MQYSPEEVFKPGTFPNLTYVSRVSERMNITYENWLKIALKKTGFLISIAGPSKTGTKVLCQKVIPEDKLISISGADFREGDDVWSVIAQYAQIPLEGNMTSELITNEQLKTTTSTHFKQAKEEVINHFNSNGLTLLIDDFQYTPEPMRKIIAQQLKDAIGKEFRAIVISLPHRADEAIRLNPDLSGRISTINLKSWDNKDLKEIASIGFKQLGISCSDEVLNFLAEESLSSPQLIQSICLNIGLIMEEQGPLAGLSLTSDICKKAFLWTTSNFEYVDVARALKAGPIARGTKRKKYRLKDGTSKDLYELILDSLAKDPPITSIKISSLKDRIGQLLSNQEMQRPALGTLKSSLNHLKALIESKETELFKVFDVKDDVLYILDPQFLFYLRWGNCSNNESSKK